MTAGQLQINCMIIIMNIVNTSAGTERIKASQVFCLASSQHCLAKWTFRDSPREINTRPWNGHIPLLRSLIKLRSY